MNIKKNVVAIFSAGTGGHVYPGLSVAEELIKNKITIFWIGTSSGIENKIISNTNIPIFHIQFSGVRGKSFFSYCKLPLKLTIAIIQALKILKGHKPSVVLSMGGYISFPCVIASFFLRIPVVIHEQNIVFGLANNILRFISNKVILGFPMKVKSNKYKYLGNPIRYETLKVNRVKRKKTKFNILIIGGSLGAKIFNEVVPEALYKLIKNTDYEINILHQTGKTYSTAFDNYKKFELKIDLREYIDSMIEAYEWCDIIVCRGGAITLSEIIYFGIPAIIVPYPHATDDHQLKNCRYLEENNAAIVIEQKNFTYKYLESILKFLIENNNQRELLSENIIKLKKENPTKNICSEIIKLLNYRNLINEE